MRRYEDILKEKENRGKKVIVENPKVQITEYGKKAAEKLREKRELEGNVPWYYQYYDNSKSQKEIVLDD